MSTRSYPIIRNDMLERGSKPPSSLKRIFKIVRKHKSQVCAQSAEPQQEHPKVFSTTNDVSEEQQSVNHHQAKTNRHKKRATVNPVSTENQPYIQNNCHKIDHNEPRSTTPTVLNTKIQYTSKQNNKRSTDVGHHRVDRLCRHSLPDKNLDKNDGDKNRSKSPTNIDRKTCYSSPVKHKEKGFKQYKSIFSCFGRRERNCISPDQIDYFTPIPSDSQKDSKNLDQSIPVSSDKKSNDHNMSSIRNSLHRNVDNTPSEHNVCSSKMRQEFTNSYRLENYDTQEVRICWSPRADETTYNTNKVEQNSEDQIEYTPVLSVDTELQSSFIKSQNNTCAIDQTSGTLSCINGDDLKDVLTNETDGYPSDRFESVQLTSENDDLPPNHSRCFNHECKSNEQISRIDNQCTCSQNVATKHEILKHRSAVLNDMEPSSSIERRDSFSVETVQKTRANNGTNDLVNTINIRSESAKELSQLGKKCRSIAAADLKRRQTGTPMSLLLYVKKKCQLRIRKILASKNKAEVPKNEDSQTPKPDDVLELDGGNPEGKDPNRKSLNDIECDANGNIIHNNSVNHQKEDFTRRSPSPHPIRVDKRKKELTEEEMVRLESFSRLDTSTLRVIGWSSGASDSMNSTQNLTEQEEDESMCKISKVEFKRLQEQVRDVSFNLRNRFRTSAYQKLYQQPQPTPLENATQLYRSQLAASLRAFKPKEWPPLNSQELETSYLRCKPINCQNDSNSSSSTRCCSAKLRPKSVPPSVFRNRAQQKRSETPTDVRPGNFDSLNPQVLSQLLNDNVRTTSYGDLATSVTKQKQDFSPQKLKDDDVSTTSGIESNPTDDTSSSDDEDDSDYEPEVDENRLAPDLFLRPEKLDSLMLPDSAKGWRKFDFDADNINIPIYAFANPLPDPFEDLDLRQIARLKWNWRDQTRHRTREKNVDDIIDRMVELERLQIDTEDWEQKRSAQVNKRISRRSTSAKNPRDKRCCSKCLQPACTGDCPEKYVQSEICELCRQSFCIKTCADTKYEQRMRQSRSDDKIIAAKTPTPKYCRSCQAKHNAKFINANNVVMGRPKSCNSTYSRGQASNKPRDYRPRSETPVSVDLFQEFDKLGIEPQQPSRPTTAKSQRPRSRNSSFPSKSFYSQRRDSLTEADKSRFKKKTQKSGKVLVRRPKTAA